MVSMRNKKHYPSIIIKYSLLFTALNMFVKMAIEVLSAIDAVEDKMLVARSCQL